MDANLVLADRLSSQKAITVSVVATVRNECETIAPFLDSLIHQTWAPGEIIVVDGLSTDGTVEILERYAPAHGIRLISRECNIAQGRNIGITEAVGSIIAVTDAGCRVERTWLERIVESFANDSEADVVAGNFKFDTFSPFEEAVVLATFIPDREQTDVARYYPSSRSVAFRKSAWRNAGGYPEWLYAGEDTLFNIRLRQIGCKFVFNRAAVVHWRPRQTLRALAKQRFNFARGNARVSIGTVGYLTNLKYHCTAIAFLLTAIAWPWALIGAVGVTGMHIKRNLWKQARAAAAGRSQWRKFLRVLGVMEFVRLVNMAGFLAGRWDRLRDPQFIKNQRAYMGLACADSVLLCCHREQLPYDGYPTGRH